VVACDDDSSLIWWSPREKEREKQREHVKVVENDRGTKVITAYGDIDGHDKRH